jgi:hypothetical protein
VPSDAVATVDGNDHTTTAPIDAVVLPEPTAASPSDESTTAPINFVASPKQPTATSSSDDDTMTPIDDVALSEQSAVESPSDDATQPMVDMDVSQTQAMDVDGTDAFDQGEVMSFSGNSTTQHQVGDDNNQEEDDDEDDDNGATQPYGEVEVLPTPAPVVVGAGASTDGGILNQREAGAVHLLEATPSADTTVVIKSDAGDQELFCNKDSLNGLTMVDLHVGFRVSFTRGTGSDASMAMNVTCEPDVAASVTHTQTMDLNSTQAFDQDDTSSSAGNSPTQRPVGDGNNHEVEDADKDEDDGATQPYGEEVDDGATQPYGEEVDGGEVQPNAIVPVGFDACSDGAAAVGTAIAGSFHNKIGGGVVPQQQPQPQPQQLPQLQPPQQPHQQTMKAPVAGNDPTRTNGRRTSGRSAAQSAREALKL